MILCPSKQSRAILGPWVDAFAKQLRHLWHWQSSHYWTCGATSEKLGKWFDLAETGLQDMIALEVDMKRFDSCLGKEVLDCEYQVYVKAGFTAKPLEVVQHQYHARGYTVHGIEFEVDGTRKSGDSNTSVGNSMINMFAHVYLMNLMQIPEADYRIAIMGDDVAILLKECHTNIVHTFDYAGFYRSIGFRAKYQVHDNPRSLSFCSSYFWPTNDGTVAGPIPGRCLLKLGWSLNREMDNSEWIYGLVHSLKSGYHVPFVREYLLRMAAFAGTRGELEEHRQIEGETYHEYCPETWEVLELVTGLTPADWEVFRLHLNEAKPGEVIDFPALV
jgi:hypothetical protein